MSVSGSLSPPQPPRHDVFLGQEWRHRYDRIRITRGSDGQALELPCSSALTSLVDFNPRWWVDQITRTKGSSLFFVFMDSSNACTDACPSCWTMNKRRLEGFGVRMDKDVALKRLGELKQRYPDTFQQIMLCGSGEGIMPGVERLIDGVRDLGLAVHTYTAGKHLGRRTIRESLLRAATQIRVSVDAVDEDTYKITHAVGGFAERMDNLRRVVQEREATGSRALIGMSMVIQEANHDQIVPFAALARATGCDFAAIHQESYGTVNGRFTDTQARAIMADLQQVETMADETFSLNLPQHARRHTVFVRRAGEMASVELMDRCRTSRQRPSFGSDTTYAACSVAGGHADYKRNSAVGSLRDDTTLDTLHTVIDKGVGTALGRPSKLNCAACELNPFNDFVDNVLGHLSDETDWDVELLPYAPRPADGYSLVLGSARPGDALAAGLDGRTEHRIQLPVVSVR
ncbi:radical SAM protein [Streptomyces sp. NPDC047061]|uniref:radical SAM protein n=1 Tax=Streptomyces sp. NPDC047061 TaxID=3154605 RepID=UPI0033C8B697